MVRKLHPEGGVVARIASAHVLVRAGVDERAGGTLPAAVVAERVGWCANLARGMVAEILERSWNGEDVGALASGVDAAGRPLPTMAWMALRRLGWAASASDGIIVNDRIARMAQEQAGRILRSAAWRANLTSAILATWPVCPLNRTPQEWNAVRAAMPGGDRLPSTAIKARTRQILRFRSAEGRLPVDLFELESLPRAVGMLLLAACDRQQATIERSPADPKRALLRLRLPVRPDPRSYRDWTWVAIPLTLPPTVPPSAALHLPTLRVIDGKVRADLAFTQAVPAARRAGHVVAVGVDWGLNTLMSAGAARLHANGTITALGAGAQYRAAGVLARQHRLRRHAEQLHAKASQYERLIADADRHPLTARKAVLAEEHRRVSQRRRNLNDALAWSAARWTVDQAIAAGATVIYQEDLRSLEVRSVGRTLSTRLSQTVRGKIADRIRYLAAEIGIAVVSVPPRGTSRNCPRCLTVLHHGKAPDKPSTSGWKWAICPGCGWEGDRDQGAWQRIAARGLTHQGETVTDRGSGAMVIRAVHDGLEAAAVIKRSPPAGRDRSKVGATRKRVSRPVPRRRGAPSPPRPCRGGQRPEGQVPTGRTLPRAAIRHQAVYATSTPIVHPHKARGAALGAGFHLHAHATPPRWEMIPGP